MCIGGSSVKLSSFVAAYERSLIALNDEANDLVSRIAFIRQKQNVIPGGRLASRLSLYEHQLASIDQKHRGAACWVVTVAQPIFMVIAKRLGSAYKGALVRAGDRCASLRFIHRLDGPSRSMILDLTMDDLDTASPNLSVSLQVRRQLHVPRTAPRMDELPMETPIDDVIRPLV